MTRADMRQIKAAPSPASLNRDDATCRNARPQWDFAKLFPARSETECEQVAERLAVGPHSLGFRSRGAGQRTTCGKGSEMVARVEPSAENWGRVS
jgi:hypothetical protein